MRLSPPGVEHSRLTLGHLPPSIIPRFSLIQTRLMPKRDRRVDTYIANSAEFARPVLRHLRKLVHAGCPEVEETLKWNFPAFMHKGILCSMAAFKQHCTFGFWKWKLIL